MSIKSYRPWAPDQPFFLPPAPRDWLPSDHLAHFVLEIVTEVLDLEPFEAVIQARERGNRPYSPFMMVALLVFAYCVGVFSSRQIERATYENVAFMVITGGQHPDHASIARFRRTHIGAFKDVFRQVVRMCRRMGILKLGRFALDGTKVKADASKHKAMSYEHMVKVESRLDDEIADLLERVEQLDQAEDHSYGERGYEDLPEELHRREVRLKRIREAKAALERGATDARIDELVEQAERHEANAADASRSDRDRRRSTTLGLKRRKRAAELRAANTPEPERRTPEAEDAEGLPFAEQGAVEDAKPAASDAGCSSSLPAHKTPHTADGEPHPNAQRNFTDPDSQIMEYQGGFIQGYNAQSLNDESGVIVAEGVSNVAPDTHHLPAMVDEAIEVLESAPEQLLADSGYWAPRNVDHCDNAGVDVYIATGRTADGAPRSATDSVATDMSASQHAAATTSGADPPPTAKAQMRAKTSTPEGRDIYRARKWIAEPPFGNIKEVQGFRQFSLRGLELVRGEWSLVTLAHNIRKAWLFRTTAA
jgi:transposase